MVHPLYTAAASLYLLSVIERQIEEDWAMAFPDDPDSSKSSVFERIAKVEQLVIWHTDKMKPTANPLNPFASTPDHIK